MKIRDAQDGDFAAIARMAQRSDLFVGELSEAGFPSMLAWLYVEAPSKIRLQFVAEHEEEVVAHYGAASIEYKLYDETCVAGFASNLVIDPDHRAGMLFISLQSYLQREYQKKNFRFVYGLVTRANVLEPHLRTGWKKIGMVPVYAKPFDFPAVAASALRHPLSRALAFAPLKAAESLWREDVVFELELVVSGGRGAPAPSASTKQRASRPTPIVSWPSSPPRSRSARSGRARSSTGDSPGTPSAATGSSWPGKTDTWPATW